MYNLAEKRLIPGSKLRVQNRDESRLGIITALANIKYRTFSGSLIILFPLILK